MFAVVQNGQVVQVVSPDQPFKVGDKQYSARFIRSSTPQEKLDAGVWEIVDAGRADDRYYWVTGPTYRLNEVNSTVEAVYTATAKALEDRLEVKEDNTPLYVQVYDPTADNGKGAMVNTTEQVVTKGLKSQNIAQVKQTAGSLLAQTDWYIVRKAETNVAVPADVTTYRAAVRTEANRLETVIAAVTTVDGLIAVKADWPKA
jgi:ABC-type proline/glycine betaine transport system ATPase subunit